MPSPSFRHDEPYEVWRAADLAGHSQQAAAAKAIRGENETPFLNDHHMARMLRGIVQKQIIEARILDETSDGKIGAKGALDTIVPVGVYTQGGVAFLDAWHAGAEKWWTFDLRRIASTDNARIRYASDYFTDEFLGELDHPEEARAMARFAGEDVIFRPYPNGALGIENLDTVMSSVLIDASDFTLFPYLKREVINTPAPGAFASSYKYQWHRAQKAKRADAGQFH